MAYVKKIKIGSTEYDIRDGRFITIVDSGSTTDGVWVASTESPAQNLTAYTDDLLFIYKVAKAGASTTTLNIDGLGAKKIFRTGTTALTTQYGVGTVLLLQYDATADSNKGGFRVVNDADANSYAYVRQYQHGANAAGTAGKYPLLARYNVTNKNGTYDTAYARYHTGAYVDTSTGELYSEGSKVLTTATPTAAAITEINPGSGSMTATTKYLHKSTTNAAPNAHTHSVTVSGTTGANSGTAVTAVTGVASDGTATVLTGVKVSGTDTFLKAVSEGSGYLKSYDAETDGTIIVDAGNRIKYVESVTHSGASASGTANAAPSGHTHTVTVSGTTGNNSGDAVTAVTSVGADGTAVALTGVKVTANPTISLTANTSTATGRITYVESISGGSGSLTTDTTSTNGIKYVESISSTKASASGTAKAGSETHTHTYDKATGINLGSNTTADGGVTYVESVTHTAATLGGTKTFNTNAIKSVTLSASDTSTDGPKYVQEISGSAPSLTGTTTFVTGYSSFSGGSGSLVAYDAATNGTAKTTNGNRIQYIHSLAKSGYTPAGSVTLTAGTAPSMNFNTGTNTDTPYISALTTGDYTPAGSVSLTNGTAPSMGSATTKYLSASASGTTVGANGTGDCAPNAHTHTVTVSGTSGANSGTAVKAVTGYASFSGGSLTGTKTFNTDAIKSIGGTRNYGFSASTSNVMYSPTVSNGVLSWSVANASTQDAHTGTAASTGTVSFTAASLGTASTADVAPSGHTHSYGSSTALTTSANSGTKVTALTGVKVTAQPTISLTANTSTATGRITYVEAQGTFAPGTTPKASASFTGTKGTVVTGGTTKYMKFSAGTTPKSSASFTGTKSTAVVTGGTTYYLAHGHSGASLGAASTSSVGIKDGEYTATTKYMKATGNAASTGTVTISGGSITPTTKYFHPSITTTSTASGAPSATTSFVTGVSGGTTSATTKYLHHSHSGASATTKYLSASASGTAVGANGTATVLTGVKATGTASVAPHTHTHSYGSSTALTTSGNSGTAVKAVTGVSGGSITSVERYLEHTHIASTEGATGTAVTAVAANGTAVVLTGVKASGTASVAPSGHTHSYGSSTALTTGNNSGSAVAAITGLTANTTAATGDITYVESVSHTHTAPSVKATASVYKSE